ncbi:MAG: hypothetical protein REH83_07415, partial [Rickettsiella sp.]|nr:hypothetical protein [Rickettsiella sp.]
MPGKNNFYNEELKIVELLELLESINAKFANLIKKNLDVSKKYTEVAEDYESFIDLIKKNKSTNPVTEFYSVEADLGRIQSRVNSIPLCPNDKKGLYEQDKQLELFGKELSILTDKTIQFKEKIPKNKPNLAKDYNAFLLQLNSYTADWNTHCYELQAAYYYNYATSLVKNFKGKKKKASDIYKKNLEFAIYFFEKSACFYEQSGKIKEKNETEIEIANKKTILRSLIQKSIPASEKIGFQKRNITISVQPFIKPSNAVASSSADKETTIEDEKLPLKKRKIVTLFNSKQAMPLAIEGAEKKHGNNLAEASIAMPIQIVNPLPVDSENESFKNEKFKELDTLLKNKCANDTLTFYLNLLFELAKFIKLDTNDSKNIFQHNLLTKLYLLETSLLLIKLFNSEKKTCFFINLEFQIQSTLDTLNKRYPSIKSWKFFHLSEFKTISFDEKSMRELFLSEIKNYLWGLETISNNYNDPKVCNVIFHNIYQLINNYFSVNDIRCTIDITIERVSTFLNSIRNEEEIFFYCRLARELVKFYVTPDNREWIATNKIPLNNSVFLQDLM